MRQNSQEETLPRPRRCRSSLDLFFASNFNYLDSPATTSATTYSTYFANANSGGGSVIVQSENTPATIILMEIAA